jgi:hypothetical protein
MGYSVIAEFPSVETQDKMLSFLHNNLTPLTEILQEETLYVRGPVADPSYCADSHANRVVGFDFTTSNPLQSRMAYLLCYWMARRIPGTIVWYDGEDKLEIPAECDDDGFHPLEKLELLQLNRSPQLGKYLRPEIAEIKTRNPRVKNELNRLTNLWKELT